MFGDLSGLYIYMFIYLLIYLNLDNFKKKFVSIKSKLCTKETQFDRGLMKTDACFFHVANVSLSSVEVLSSRGHSTTQVSALLLPQHCLNAPGHCLNPHT